MSDRDPYREAGVIKSVDVCNWRDGPEPNTVWLHIDFEGSVQGFGGLLLTKDNIDVFLDTLVETFGVKNRKALVGQECYALRSFPTWNEPIQGLESKKTGQKATLNSLRKAMGYKTISRFQSEKESIESSIVHNRRRIEEDKAALKKLESHYKEWDE